jgi:gluconate:H+ symporter, GntP family
MSLPAAAAESVPVAGPMLALLVGVVVVVLGIARWKIHPFFALMLAAVSVGVVTALGGWSELTTVGSIDLATRSLGNSAGSIAVIIAMAAVIGECLTVSRGAERVVDVLLKLWGEQRAAMALALAGFILAIPVFFDTVFLLLLPVARVLAQRTGKDYMFYVLALCAGAVIAHASVPPTPGPLLVADQLGLSLALAIGAGVACGLIPAVIGVMVARWISNRLQVTPPEFLQPNRATAAPMPSLLASFAPVILPLLMIGGVSAAELAMDRLPTWITILGDKHVALGVGMVAALGLAQRSAAGKSHSLQDLLGRPLEMAGPIILITAAGGAFGAMLRAAGIGEAVSAMAEGSSMNFVLLAWLIAAVLKAAQGSSTVAMITSTGILAAAAGDSGWGVNPVWVFLAIGYGSLALSWANDSGFWLVSRLCGWDESTTLKSWTVTLSSISVSGLGLILVLSSLG